MISLSEFGVRINEKNEWILITEDVRKAVRTSGVSEGICVVFAPHSTAAITVTENVDPYASFDFGLALNAISPDRPELRHGGSNLAAYIKTSLVGPSVTLIVTDGKPLLETCQAIWFIEFGSPHESKVYVRVMGEQRQ